MSAPRVTSDGATSVGEPQPPRWMQWLVSSLHPTVSAHRNRRALAGRRGRSPSLCYRSGGKRRLTPYRASRNFHPMRKARLRAGAVDCSAVPLLGDDQRLRPLLLGQVELARRVELADPPGVG